MIPTLIASEIVKYDDPDKFLTKLVDAIEKQGDFEIDDFEIKKIRDRFSNKRQDVYIDLDKGQGGFTVKDNESGKVFYVNISWYNDPGKNHDGRYEMIYHF
jgi:hypothetical protein